MLSSLIKPLLLTLTISSAVAYFFSNNLVQFSKYFILSILLQIVLFNIYKSIVYLFAEKIKNERIKEFSKQGMEITCPCYLSKKMFIPVTLNGDNSFNCLECKRDVSVEVSCKAFMKTDMINLDEGHADLLKAYKEIQEK